MPERRWRRRRDRSPQDEPTLQAENLQPAGTGTEYLRRAVSCYLRAGKFNEAADCLIRLAERDRAAQLYLRAGAHRLAAEAYAEAGETEAAAWVHVHHLDDAESARAIVNSNRSAPPASAGPDRTQLWRIGVSRLGERVHGFPPTAGEAAGTESMRDGIVALTRKVLDDTSSAGDIAPFLPEIGQLKLKAVSSQDWRTGYAARELERLLTGEQEARTEERRQAERRRGEDLVRTLSQRQVLARCDVADGIAEHRILSVLAETQELLADARLECAERTETWAVAIAEAMRRYDQAALIFAAAVRGRRPGAAARWRDWSIRVLHADVTILADAEPS